VRAITFLPADWMTRTSFTRSWDVDGPGVGSVERNIVVNTTTLKQGKNYRQQKTITMPFVVETKKDLNKKTTVVEAVQVIVHLDGLNHY